MHIPLKIGKPEGNKPLERHIGYVDGRIILKCISKEMRYKCVN
jgi:hypothetical protein